MLALIANCHRDPKKSSESTPADWNPLRQKTAEQRPTVGVEILKTVFIDKKVPDQMRSKPTRLRVETK